MDEAHVGGMETDPQGAVDPDTGSKILLRGRVVTMSDRGVLDGAVMAIDKGHVVAIIDAGDVVPVGFEGIPEVDTRSTLYPGLIDLHGHRTYNICTLWPVPAVYTNRLQWQAEPGYVSTVEMPLRRLTGNPDVAPSIARYVEAKAIVGGTCTGHGMNLRRNGVPDPVPFYGGMRNVEATADSRLPEADSRTPDLSPADFAKFRQDLKQVKAFFYHLSEGTDNSAHERFVDLSRNGLLADSLVGIHSLALTPRDFDLLNAAEAKVVWSPFSNLLLYGATLSIQDVMNTGVPVALGCDWSVTGSKNLLEELKVARAVVRTQRAPITDEELVRMVTVTPARILGWDQWLGAFCKPRSTAFGMLADVVAVRGMGGDPYSHLIEATEESISLVLIHGVPRYGDPELISRIAPGLKLDGPYDIAGEMRSFNLQTANSPINSLSIRTATAVLEAALSSLDDRSPEITTSLSPLPRDRTDFTLEFEELGGGSSVPGLAAGGAAEIASVIALDSLFVDDEHRRAIRSQRNLPSEVVGEILKYL